MRNNKFVLDAFIINNGLSTFTLIIRNNLENEIIVSNCLNTITKIISTLPLCKCQFVNNDFELSVKLII